jgi:hypothetical protein
MEQMVTVLPYGFRDHQRRVLRDLPEDFHTASLAVDESVVFLGVEWVAAPNLKSELPDRAHDSFLGAILRGPALLIRG